MRSGWRRAAAGLLILLSLTALPGCWDSRELDSLFIVMGVALDKSEEKDAIDLTIQIGKPKSTAAKGESKDQSSSVILMRATAENIISGLTELNQSSSRTLILQHNQALLLGRELAEEGVEDKLDAFLRDQEARLEVPVAVVDGKAEDVLTAKLKEEDISAMYLSKMMEDLQKISPEYRVRLLDFLARLLTKTDCPVVPLIAVEEKNGNQELRLKGLAVFREGKMVGHLSNQEADGYLWAMDGVNQGEIDVTGDQGWGSLRIRDLTTKRRLSLGEDGTVRVELDVNAALTVEELHGFADLQPQDLMKNLNELVTKQIQKQIEAAYRVSQKLGADIYGFGTSVYRKYPGQWKEMRDRWEELYKDIDLDIHVRVKIAFTGQTVKTVEMEGKTSEN